MSDLFNLKGKTALVTGCNRGIGRAMALGLAGAGADIVGVSAHLPLKDSDVEKEVRALGRQFTAYQADLGSREALYAFIAEVREGRHEIEILVNNAGAAVSAPFLKTGNADFGRMLDVNLMGPVIATRALLPGMMARKFGRIVNIASTAGLKGYPYVSAYVASKHALLGLTRSLALETAKTGVTVNAVCPGFTDTDLVAGSIDNIMKKTGRSREQAIAELSKHNPQARLIAPKEVADTVLWLCGEGASAITGQAVAVAGGEI